MMMLAAARGVVRAITFVIMPANSVCVNVAALKPLPPTHESAVSCVQPVCEKWMNKKLLGI